MSEKRFKSTIDEETMSIMPYLVSDKEEECFYNLQGCVDLLNELNDENRQLKQILKDIVEVTDETYTKNTSICKVIAVFDYKKYLKIKECLNE